MALMLVIRSKPWYNFDVQAFPFAFLLQNSLTQDTT
jgi:hypothetical protein